MPRLKAQLRRIARVKDCCARAVAGTAVKKLPIGAKKKRVQLTEREDLRKIQKLLEEFLTCTRVATADALRARSSPMPPSLDYHSISYRTVRVRVYSCNTDATVDLDG